MEEANQKSIVVMTYNYVDGYPAGIYGNGKLVIHSHDDRCYEHAPSVMGRLLHDIHHKVDLDDVEKMYIYVGKYGLDSALSAASRFCDEKNIVLVGCSCDWGKKKSFADAHNLKLIECDCGGKHTLAGIVKEILNEG